MNTIILNKRFSIKLSNTEGRQEQSANSLCNRIIHINRKRKFTFRIRNGYQKLGVQTQNGYYPEMVILISGGRVIGISFKNHKSKIYMNNILSYLN